MATLILRDQDIQTEMQKTWVKSQVDSHLQAMLYWVRHGYEFTEEQLERLGWLCEFIERGNEDESV